MTLLLCTQHCAERLCASAPLVLIYTYFCCHMPSEKIQIQKNSSNLLAQDFNYAADTGLNWSKAGVLSTVPSYGPNIHSVCNTVEQGRRGTKEHFVLISKQNCLRTCYPTSEYSTKIWEYEAWFKRKYYIQV